ncbi:hydrogenase formation protein HypD [Candidatus Woesearchaeota archaeon CG11_big_fil_rev_8_21_14_0_20_43_8]|nr:MAG: hydrogenase formation protein HypD [Candidatus Woesearchaeota archaeon CG11_big_fil_rev_8_21_14_0_20_43_8]
MIDKDLKNPDILKGIIFKINKIAKDLKEPVNLMEVCGTHSQTIAKYGIRSILPKNVRLISGPGCPVCVTSQQDIDNIIELARQGVTVVTYGDMLRVPGTVMTLEKARAEGADVKHVYSALDSLKYKDAVFFAIGFETTAPMTAVAVKKGLTIYPAHKTIPAALSALISMELKISGFLQPGHVSAIIGSRSYSDLKIAQVISGFEAIDVLSSIYMLLEMIRDGKKGLHNEYLRIVSDEGNIKAQKILDEVFRPSDALWRGLGCIKGSGLTLKDKYKDQDAKIIYADILDKVPVAKEPKGCRCGDVLCGLCRPNECPLFSKSCTPKTPNGACMVSHEGSCQIEYRYGDL